MNNDNWKESFGSLVPKTVLTHIEHKEVYEILNHLYNEEDKIPEVNLNEQSK